MCDKLFVRGSDLVLDSFRLARAIYDSGFRPDLILVLWRGGTPVGMAIHEFMAFKGVPCNHAVIKAQSYTGIGTRGETRLENLDRVVAALTPGSRVLVVDDIFDSGRTIAAVRRALEPHTPHVKVATVYLRRRDHEAGPDFFLHETGRWVVFPHELDGLTADEIRLKDPALAALLDDAHRPGRTPAG